MIPNEKYSFPGSGLDKINSNFKRYLGTPGNTGKFTEKRKSFEIVCLNSVNVLLEETILPFSQEDTLVLATMAESFPMICLT